MKPTHKLTLDIGADTMEFKAFITKQTMEVTEFIDVRSGLLHLVTEDMVIKKERI